MTEAVDMRLGIAANEGEEAEYCTIQPKMRAASSNHGPPPSKVFVRTLVDQAKFPEKQATTAGHNSSSSSYPLTIMSKT